MKRLSFFQRIRAAHALAIAMTDGVKPSENTLAALGLNSEFAKLFQR